MPKGKTISEQIRLMIYNSLVNKGLDAVSTWRILFNNDKNEISSLRTLEDLESMFHNPEKNLDTCNYLYSTKKRGVESQDHSVFDAIVNSE